VVTPKSPPEVTIHSIVVMGVSGSGKTTVGENLAKLLGAQFLDADWLHSHDNLESMAAGRPLSDQQREPWLHAVGENLREASEDAHDLVIACSALRRRYRDVLRTYVPDVYFVFLDATPELLRERVTTRQHEFMPASLLESQLATLEPLGTDEHGVREDSAKTPEQIVRDVIDGLS
jgi:carbohydrate kinase (thermoresistant glucokinase family)